MKGRKARNEKDQKQAVAKVAESTHVTKSDALSTILKVKGWAKVEPLLRGFDLSHEHCLVIDKEASRASVCTGPEAANFLREHRPPLPDLSPEQVRQVEESVARGWHEVQVDPVEVARAMQEQRARVGQMMSWLDMCPVPPRGRDDF